VGFMGWPTREKGLGIATNAFAILEKKLPRAHLLVAGNAPPAGATPGLASSSKIQWLGLQEDLAAFFAGLDLFIMPSRSEGLGSAALLAMAHGVPVVATRVGGLPEVVEEGKTGWLVEPDSHAALAEALISAASDSARLREFGANGRARALQFSAGAMVERTEALYRRLLGSA
jgi:glycosyltransferase involved in cell wall biosynthesis